MGPFSVFPEAPGQTSFLAPVTLHVLKSIMQYIWHEIEQNDILIIYLLIMQLKK